MLRSPALIRHWSGLIWLACPATVFPQPTLFAQSLRLSSASASRGNQVILELSMESPAGKEPLALQWDTRIPVARLTLADDRFLLGATAQEAGKSLNCAVKEKTAETYTLRCILAGGQKPIPNGTIAMLKLKIAKNAPIGAAPIRVDQGTAVSKDLKQVPLDAVEAVVAIRR